MGGLEGTCKRMLEADPTFVMGKVFVNGVRLIGTGESVRKNADLAADIENLRIKDHTAKMKECNKRESLHINAIDLFSLGRWEDAAGVWEQILIDHPKDVLALKLAHDTYFYLGMQTQIRDSVARVLPHFRPHDRYYGYLKGMLSFGQEETNYFNDAEKSAQEALSINKNDAWASHTLAHVFEMQGRYDEGIDYMTKHENDWSQCGLLACHIYWHWALYALEKADTEQVLKLYDEKLAPRVKSSGTMLDIVDGCSLLYRMRLEGINIDDRWQDVAEICRSRVDDQILMFNDVHFLMGTAVADGKIDQLGTMLMNNVQNRLQQKNVDDNSNYRTSGAIGSKILHGIQSYEQGKFADVVEYLYPVKHKIIEIGGSNAQRDVFNQLLIHACIQETTPHYQRLAKNLLYERSHLKPNSPLTDRLMAKLLA